MTGGGAKPEETKRTGHFVSDSGELWERVRGPGSVAPLSDAISGIVGGLVEAGEKEVDFTLPIGFANDGRPGGPLRAFSLGGSAHSIRIRGTIVRDEEKK